MSRCMCGHHANGSRPGRLVRRRRFARTVIWPSAVSAVRDVPMPPKRALLVIRLSRVTDATTSPQRQIQICSELCEQRRLRFA